MDWSRCIVHLYMLTCDLTSLVSLQFSHWLQVRKVGTFNSYSFIPSILMVLICLYFAQELWVVYFCLQITDIRQKLSKIRYIDALNLLWNTYFLWSPPNTPSLHHRCNLTLVNNMCEAVLISLLWALNRLIKSPEVCFKFPFVLIGKLIMASSTGQSWCITESWNQSLVLSLTQQARRYDFL